MGLTAKRKKQEPPVESETDVGSEFSRYDKKLKLASRARARVANATQCRATDRKCLGLAYEEARSEFGTTNTRKLAQYRRLRIAQRLACIWELERALEIRAQEFEQIARKLGDIQQIAANLGVQLGALYQGRLEDLSGTAAPAA
ncbi:hypothetical protein QBC46DRAFT_408955 [Diplogelasinospora grovesii]|uniref:Uncharacterized protein n=1 Tax=Diplogelasinospora grovesii TaxID=303347 RepID=A0AAN6N765_9PEZI|nr:hypothetical protein QBC46DRAFT_408955 [Diplogelasinospora grovesii]